MVVDTDHAPRGSGNRGGIRDGESVRWPGCGGSVIRHAAAGAVGALPVAMVETPFGAALMAGPGGSNRPAASDRAAPRRAVGLAAVTRRADGERSVALTTDLLAEGLVHGVGARGAVSDWTPSLNRGTTAATGSICRSSGRSRGVRLGHNRALTPRLSPLPTLPERRAGRQRRGRGRRRSPRTQRTRFQGAVENRKERGFPQRPQPSLFPLHQDPRKPVPEPSASTSVENSSGFDDR